MTTRFATAAASASAGSVLMAVAKPESPRDRRFTRALAAQNAAWTFDAVPADARKLVRHCLLDWIAVTLGRRAGAGDTHAG
jgi:hypothetical protein